MVGARWAYDKCFDYHSSHGEDRRSRKGWKKCNVTDHQRPLIPSQSSLGAVASCRLRAPCVLQARGNNTQRPIKDEYIPFGGIDTHSEKRDMFLYFGLPLEGVRFSNRFVAKLQSYHYQLV